jgi:membrane-associated protein
MTLSSFFSELITSLEPLLLYPISALIVFAESALLIGVILPGDSLLFTLGLIAATTNVNVWLLWLCCFTAAVIGDGAGYALGKKYGSAIFNKPKSLVFKPENVVLTQKYFEKYGKKTIVISRFTPVIRSIVPTMAGVAGMPYRDFALYNALGGLLWTGTLIALGYLLNDVLGTENIDTFILPIVGCVIALSLIEPLRQIVAGLPKKWELPVFWFCGIGTALALIGALLLPVNPYIRTFLFVGSVSVFLILWEPIKQTFAKQR